MGLAVSHVFDPSVVLWRFAEGMKCGRRYGDLSGMPATDFDQGEATPALEGDKVARRRDGI